MNCFRTLTNPGEMSRDLTSANHQHAGVIHQPIALHPVAQPLQQPTAVILTPSTNPTQLPLTVGGHQLPVAISTMPVPPPVFGPSINVPPNYAFGTDFHPDFGFHSGYGRSRNPKQDWIDGQQTVLLPKNYLNYILF